MKKMKNIDKSHIHNLAEDEADRASKDEIIQLDVAFTKMMKEIDTLVDQVNDREIVIRDEIIARQKGGAFIATATDKPSLSI